PTRRSSDLGLRASAVRLLHRAAVWHGIARNALEARESRRWVLGATGRNAFFRHHVYADEIGSSLGERIRFVSACTGTRAVHVPCALFMRNLGSCDRSVRVGSVS